jgi:hypothetical protein
MHRFPRRPSPAMAVAFIALLAALSGTAVALPGKNTVDSGDIKKGAVKRSDVGRNAIVGGKVRNGSLGGADVRNDNLTGTDINESTLGQVPSANTANSATTASNATNADKLDGRDASDLDELWAKVDSTAPSIVRGNGTTGLEGPAVVGVTGTYRIAFDRDVSGCVNVASIASDDGAVPPPGEIGVTNSVANPNAVAVTTHNSGGTAVNTLDFVVAVFC